MAGAEWVINIQEAAEKRGIENPYQLWQKLGGSKQTAAQLWKGETTMIKTETMNHIQNVLGINPFEYIFNEGTRR